MSEVLNSRIKSKYLTYCLWIPLSQLHNSPWLRTESMTCQLCGLTTENVVHTICLCKSTLDIWRRWLRPLWNLQGVRSCRQAILVCLNSSDQRSIPRTVNYIHGVERALKKTSGTQSPLYTNQPMPPATWSPVSPKWKLTLKLRVNTSKHYLNTTNCVITYVYSFICTSTLTTIFNSCFIIVPIFIWTFCTLYRFYDYRFVPGLFHIVPILINRTIKIDMK